LFLVIGFAVAWRLITNIAIWYERQLSLGSKMELGRQLMPFLRRVALILLTVIAAIMLLDYFHVEISGFVATLGIGSLAIALAAQAALSDTISGFIIMIDRPYRIGDRIEIQDLDTWGDVETHFDLGIAYREMGLLEDAIGEFRYALGFPSRRLDALQLMGLCALDLGRAQDAVGHLEQALASPEIPAEREAPLRYELGRAYQALPDRARALETFRRVFELEPDFQDVEERVAELEQVDDPAAAANASAEEAEAYESFDDLVADAADTAPPAPVERFETFDDLVAEANDEPSAGSVADTIDADTDAAFVEASVVDDDDTDSGEPYAAEPISEAELEAEPIADSESESDCEPQPAEPATSTPRRRRKVSFV
jgi:tetratricopeptide (TPR) repeat protein